MIAQPASRDGTVAGTNIVTLFHVSDVPGAITAGPAALIKDALCHLDLCQGEFATNSVFCIHTSINKTTH